MHELSLSDVTSYVTEQNMQQMQIFPMSVLQRHRTISITYYEYNFRLRL